MNHMYFDLFDNNRQTWIRFSTKIHNSHTDDNNNNDDNKNTKIVLTYYCFVVVILRGSSGGILNDTGTG